MVETRPLEPDEPDDEPAGRPATLAETDAAATVEAAAAQEPGVGTSLAAEFVARARTARDQHHGQPPATWSTGEQAAVALLLGSSDTLHRLELTAKQAITHLADDLQIAPREAAEWAIHARQNL